MSRKAEQVAATIAVAAMVCIFPRAAAPYKCARSTGHHLPGEPPSISWFGRSVGLEIQSTPTATLPKADVLTAVNQAVQTWTTTEGCAPPNHATDLAMNILPNSPPSSTIGFNFLSVDQNNNVLAFRDKPGFLLGVVRAW